jgi:hypothetical protein
VRENLSEQVSSPAVRAQLKAALEFVRELDRLARSGSSTYENYPSSGAKRFWLTDSGWHPGDVRLGAILPFRREPERRKVGIVSRWGAPPTR